MEVVPITELIHPELKMTKADVLELVDDATLEHGPKSFNRIGVNIPVHVPIIMLNYVMGESLVYAGIAFVLVRHEMMGTTRGLSF